jgi:hypothetical protein
MKKGKPKGCRLHCLSSHSRTLGLPSGIALSSRLHLRLLPRFENFMHGKQAGMASVTKAKLDD